MKTNKEQSDKDEWMIPKSIKFSRSKLQKAKDQKKIKNLAELCRKQLDKLIKE